MLNAVVLIGRLTKDPELKYTASGKAVASFTVAVDRGTKDSEGKKETDFIRCVAWEKRAETVVNYLRKGRLVAIQGRLQIRQYEKDGQRREIAEVVANQVQFLDRGAEQEAGGLGGARIEPPGMGFESNLNNDDDVPF